MGSGRLRDFIGTQFARVELVKSKTEERIKWSNLHSIVLPFQVYILIIFFVSRIETTYGLLDVEKSLTHSHKYARIHIYISLYIYTQRER